jgi:chemotaxis signal transduction protein
VTREHVSGFEAAAHIQQDGFRVCLFQLAHESFGLRLESVSEIVPMAALSRPPCMPRKASRSAM